MQKIMLLVVVLLGFILLSCTKSSDEKSGFVVAKLNGNPITLGQLDESLGNAVYTAKKQIFDTRQRMLEEMIGEKLLEQEANSKGVKLDDLKKDILKNIEPLKDEEVDRFYDMAKKRNSNVSKEDIKNYLTDRQNMIEERKFIAGLKAKAKIENFIEKLEPQAPRLKVEVGDDPQKGPEDAKVTLVEFSYYGCYHCGQAQPTLEKILKEYEGKVRLVRKDYPLSNQDSAMLPHLASNCANEQGKYWEYSETVWKNTSKMADKDLKQYAKDLGLDTKKFNDCLDSKKYKAEIEQDLNEGRALGVSGTPAFFVNGLMISGARPFESFKEVIDKEL